MSAINRGSVRLDADFYPTPIKTIDAIISRIDFGTVKTFLEPCKGDGRILNLIPAHVSRQSCEIREGVNYFDSKFNVDLIITNPPFSVALEFLEKSLKEAATVCYLQRLNWLGSQKRKAFWNKNAPDKLLVLSQRPQFKKELGLLSGTDATEYAWFIWDKPNIVRCRGIEVY